MCSTEQRKSRRFGAPWGWVNDKNFWVNYPFNSHKPLDCIQMYDVVYTCSTLCTLIVVLSHSQIMSLYICVELNSAQLCCIANGLCHSCRLKSPTLIENEWRPFRGPQGLLLLLFFPSLFSVTFFILFFYYYCIIYLFITSLLIQI